MTSRPAESSEATASSGDARHVGDRVRSVEAAAIAGIAYAVLSIAARAILASVPDIDDPGLIEWLSDGGNQDLLLLALNLTSVSTVAFLWFIAVIRRRVGDREDQFFSTVFVGSGIVLIASTLLATAAAVTPAIGMRLLGADELDAAEVSVARSLGAAVALIVAPRMQAVFVFATSTVVLRSRALPRWLAWVGYGLGVVLFVVPFLTDPIGVVFPVWVMLVSVVILASRTRELGDDDDAESATRLLGGR